MFYTTPGSMNTPKKPVDPVILLMQLVDIPSLTGQEREVCLFVYELLQSLPFDSVEKIIVDENGFNILARKGMPKVTLQAHLDVVQPHIPASLVGETVFGRGSCDTKSCVATMILAASRALDAGISDFALLFTVGEETDLRGVKKVVESQPNLGFTIVGEPTKLHVVSSHYGMMSLQVEATGKAAHTSQADHGVNAILLLTDAITKLSQVPMRNGSLVSIVKIEGGIASNIVPESARAKYSFRLAPTDNTDYFSEFSQAVAGLEGIRIQKRFEAPPVASQVPEALSFLGEGEVVKYFTELSYLKHGVILGPGDIIHAHTQEEHIEKHELEEAVDLYLKILQAMSVMSMTTMAAVPS